MTILENREIVLLVILHPEPVSAQGTVLVDACSIPESPVGRDGPDNVLPAGEPDHHPVHPGPAGALSLPRQVVGLVSVDDLQSMTGGRLTGMF